MAMGENHRGSSETSLPLYRAWLCGSFRLERRAGLVYTVLDTKEWGGHSSPRTVLKALICAARRRASRGALLAQIWPEADGEQASRDLNVAISRLRKILRPVEGQECLTTEDDSLGFSLVEQSVFWVDADAALALLEEVVQTGPHSPVALPLLEEAWRYFQRGGFLENDEGEWAENKRAIMERGRYRCQLWLAEAYARQGMFGPAETILNELLGDDPTNEEAVCHLMDLFHQHGLTHQALLLYKQTCEVFAREGLEISAAIQNLVTRFEKDRQTSFLRLSMAGAHSFLADALSLFRRGVLSPFALSDSSYAFAPSIQAEDELQPPFYIQMSQRCQKTPISEALQMPLQDMLAKFDALAAQIDQDQYRLSRRQILVALATLPLAMFSFDRPHSDVAVAEIFLPQCAASLVACNQLIKSQDFWYVKNILIRLIPALVHIIQHVSSYQVAAAHLLAQCYLLLGILESHQLNWEGYTTFNRHALNMSLLTPDKSLQVVAHVQLAMAFFHFEQPFQALSLYEGAAHLIPESSPLVQSDFFVKRAVAYAQAGQVANMHQCLEQADTVFPKRPESDPSSLFTDFGTSSLLSWKATAQLQLAHQQLESPGDVWKTLSEADFLPAQSSSKVLVYVQTLRAETALALNDLERFASFLAAGVVGAKQLRSARRFQEAVDCYRMAQKRWPGEIRLRTLGELFVREHPKERERL